MPATDPLVFSRKYSGVVNRLTMLAKMSSMFPVIFLLLSGFAKTASLR